MKISPVCTRILPGGINHEVKKTVFRGKSDSFERINPMNSSTGISRNEQLLLNLVNDFKKCPEVEGIMLGGSTAAKIDDSKSDFDVYIYCSKEPDVEKRKEIALKYSKNPEIDNHYFETGDVFCFEQTGKPVDIMYRSPEFAQAQVKNVWQNGEASMGYSTCFVDNLKRSKILYDKNGRLAAIQQELNTPYPDKLQKNIINKNFPFLKDAMFSYRDQMTSAVQRDDLVSLNHRSAAFLASYFDVIFAKNKVLNPGEKKLVNFALNNCKILPKDFKKDVEIMAAGNPDARLDAADRMVENLREIL